ncbi:UDP-N-acetylmuramoyl-tripeptide--D-alanyl-D-alanine ligase [Treponema sp.]|uniref:UDP-N-acetylmuramoyl-tripeptide--D-alanyl-D- alanine ligase n=1 Tax=Treponema sp. TaxID=166 RepID=UPI003F0F4A22
MNADNSLLTLEEILDAVDGIRVLGGDSLHIASVQTDSRLVGKDTLFVPLAGEKQDGHLYVPQALEKGASAVFICMKNFEGDSGFFVSLHEKYPDVVFIAVKNTLEALQRAAAKYVEKFPRLIKIGVTGSSGKTTTKEILVSILSQKYRVVFNKGNFNSETGLPLSVFNIRAEHECGVFEMGMNRVNEIGEIASVLKPRFAVVTNIGTAHIGILGSREKIAEEKAKIFSYFGGFGTGVIPADDDFTGFLQEKIDGKTVLYGGDTASVKYVRSLGLKGTVFSIDGIETVLALPGVYNYRNALGAVALAQSLGLSAREIADGISALKPLSGRSEILEGKNYFIMQDCYNANPDSMEKALDFVSSIKKENGSRKILVLGDMLELGSESKAAHEKIGGLAAASDADFIVFVGTEIKAAFDSAQKNSDKKIFYAEGNSDGAMQKAACEIQNVLAGSSGSVVLLKGSRGMRLERISEILLGKGSADD